MRRQGIQPQQTKARSPTPPREQLGQDIAYFKTKRPWRRVSLVALMNFLITPATFGSDLAPPSAEKPWSPPGLNAYERELAQRHFSNEKIAKEVEINGDKICELPELIYIAEL